MCREGGKSPVFALNGDNTGRRGRSKRRRSYVLGNAALTGQGPSSPRRRALHACDRPGRDRDLVHAPAECNPSGPHQEGQQARVPGYPWPLTRQSAASYRRATHQYQFWAIMTCVATYEPEFVSSDMSTSTLPSTSAAPMRPLRVALTPPTTLTSRVRPSAGWPWNLATAACASFSFL